MQGVSPHAASHELRDLVSALCPLESSFVSNTAKMSVAAQRAATSAGGRRSDAAAAPPPMSRHCPPPEEQRRSRSRSNSLGGASSPTVEVTEKQPGPQQSQLQRLRTVRDDRQRSSAVQSLAHSRFDASSKASHPSPEAPKQRVSPKIANHARRGVKHLHVAAVGRQAGGVAATSVAGLPHPAAAAEQALAAAAAATAVITAPATASSKRSSEYERPWRTNMKSVSPSNTAVVGDTAGMPPNPAAAAAAYQLNGDSRPLPLPPGPRRTAHQQAELQVWAKCVWVGNMPSVRAFR